MSDTAYFFIIVSVLACVAIAFIYRALAKRRHPKKKNEQEKVERFNELHREINSDIDPVNSPAFDDSEFNIFYDDHEK
jgi:NADH:ubiquinone oxidoreductase subunit 3 (subunit A)